MTVIISRTIKAKELQKGLLGDMEREVVIESFKKGIYTVIKGIDLPKNTNTYKIYATTIQGARRILYLVNTKTGDAALLFYRSKNDRIGNNMSVKNPEFCQALIKHIRIFYKDFEAGNVERYDENWRK